MVKNFVHFVREQGVVGLAVGLAIGASAGDAVKSIVDNFISPLVGLILGGTDLSGISSTITRSGKELVFGWGNILNAVITLLATAFVVYFIVDKAGLTKADKKSDK
jgi:large conductance mechanosensitive channel